MDLDRLSLGEKIASVSAILLLVFMFFDWFGVEVVGVPGFSGSIGESGGSAWEALDYIPIVLVLAIAAGLAVAGLRLGGLPYEPVVPANAIVAMLGGISVLLILFRIVDPPSLSSYGGVPVDATLKVGVFLGLIAAGGIAYGGYSAMREEGVSFGDAADRLGRGSGAG
jgi:hypothetical protein